MTSARELRSFGLIVGGVAGAFAVFGKHRTALGCLSLLLLVLAMVAPRTLELPRRAWFKIGSLLGWINSRVLLTIVFFGVITPMGWIRRRFGVPALRLGFEPDRATYAEPTKNRDAGHFKFQF